MTSELLAHDLVTHAWSVSDAFVPKDLAAALAVEARALRTDGQFREAGVGRGAALQIRPEIRSDQVLWLSPKGETPAQVEYLRLIEELRAQVNQLTFMGLFRFEGHLACYPPGAFYRPHLDRFRSASHRWVSCILYLNDAWEEAAGGQLRAHLPDGPVDIIPTLGTFVTFFSGDILHEVLPARRERYSLTGWLCLRE